MGDRIQKLFTAQERLVADVSHELRTPLTTVQGNIDLLQRMLNNSNQGANAGQLRLIDLIDVTSDRSDRSAYQTALNRIGQRQVDFVICDRMTFRPLLAIELDDATHDRSRRMKSDDFENEALKSAGLSLLRLRGRYEVAQLLEQIERALIPPPSAK